MTAHDEMHRRAADYQRTRRERQLADQRSFALNSPLRQTYDIVRTQLAGLAPGNPLVEADLMESLAASRGTIRTVLQLLADEGLVSRKTKVGTRVAPSVHLPFAHLLPDDDKPVLDVSVSVSTSVVSAPRFLQELFGLDAGSHVVTIDGQMFHEAVPIGVSVGYVPLTADEAAQADRWARSTVGTIDFVERQLGVPLGSSRARLGSLSSDSDTADKLAVPVGSPLLWLEQIFVDMDGRDRGLLHARYRADRVSFSGQMRRFSSPDISESPRDLPETGLDPGGRKSA